MAVKFLQARSADVAGDDGAFEDGFGTHHAADFHRRVSVDHAAEGQLLLLQDQFLILAIDQHQKRIVAFRYRLLHKGPDLGVHSGAVGAVFKFDEGHGEPAVFEDVRFQCRRILVAHIPRGYCVESVEGCAPVQAFDGRSGLAVVRLAVRYICEVFCVFIVRLQADDFRELHERVFKIFSLQSRESRLVQFDHMGVLDLLVCLTCTFHEQQTDAQFGHAVVVRFRRLECCDGPCTVVGHARFIKLPQVVIQHPLPCALEAGERVRIGGLFLDGRVVKTGGLRHHAHFLHFEPAFGVGFRSGTPRAEAHGH